VPKYLLSGLLVCGQCGSKFVVVNRTSYGCAGHINGRLCQNNLLVRRDCAEDLLLAGIRDELLTPEIEVEARSRIAKKLVERVIPNPASRRRVELQAEIDNLAEAIAAGLLRSSPALADRLARAERELLTLQPQEILVDASKVTAMLPRVMDAFRAMVANLGDLARRDVGRARTEARKLVGEITLQPENGVLIAEIKKAHVAGALITAAGGRQQMVMVAGACYRSEQSH
jgi:site-specific DNA recombinase